MRGNSHCICFNPRPPRSERTTRRLRGMNYSLKVSIHVRPDRSGRPRAPPGAAARRHVSIHVRPDRSGRQPEPRGVRPPGNVSIHVRPDRSGRRLVHRRPNRWQTFQSTSAPIGADDSPTRRRLLRRQRFNPRPPRSERTTPVSGICHGSTPVSIHVRPDRSGRRRATAPSSRTTSRFNPRPPRSERTTTGTPTDGALTAVSIHVRPDRSGRRADQRDLRVERQRFNPRPPRSERTTSVRMLTRRCWAGFNPRPPRSERTTSPGVARKATS